MEEKRIKSVIPYYTIGLVWLLYGFIMPLYSFLHIVVASGLSLAAFLMSYRLIPDKVVMIESKTPTKNPLADEYINLARDYSKKMETLIPKLKGSPVDPELEDIHQNLIKIMDFILKYPQKAGNLRRFMDYFLPTTIKLAENYSHLKDQKAVTENIVKSKTTIEEALPVMAKSFAKQLDALFADKAMDIDAEVKLLKKLLVMEDL